MSNRPYSGVEDDEDDDYDEEEILLGRELDEEEPDLGPDERDRDLLDGTWEQQYYGGRQRSRDWSGVYTAFALLLVLALIVPLIAAVTP